MGTWIFFLALLTGIGFGFIGICSVMIFVFINATAVTRLSEEHDQVEMTLEEDPANEENYEDEEATLQNEEEQQMIFNMNRMNRHNRFNGMFMINRA